MSKKITRTVRTNHVHIFTTELVEGQPVPKDAGMFDVVGIFKSDGALLSALKKQHQELSNPIITEVVKEDAVYSMDEMFFLENAELVETEK